MEEVEARSRFRAAALAAALMLISAYDVYFAAIALPVVPIFGVFLLLVLIHVRNASHLPVDASLIVLLSLAALTLASSLWGLFYFGDVYLKGPAGVLLGLLTVGTVLRGSVSKRELYDALTLVLAAHWILWAIQFFGFLATGRVVDYMGPLTGLSSRSGYYGFTRFTGFFGEPAAFALFMFMGLSARLVYNKFQVRRFDALLFAAVLTSLSVSGYFLALILLLIAVVRMRPRRAAATLAIAALAIWGVVAFVGRSNLPLIEWVVKRASAPTADPSGAVRSTAVISRLLAENDVTQLFGIGVGNYEESVGSVSGIQNLIEAFGMVGCFVFIGGMLTLFLIRRVRPLAFVLWTLSLFATAMWTVPYWWLWTGLLIAFASSTVRLTEFSPAPVLTAV